MANVDIRLGYKNSTWFTNNATLILKEGQTVHLLQTGQYKIGDGTTQLSALSFLGGSGSVDVNNIGAAINGASSATPNDTDLVMSVESSVAKKNTWIQIKSFLKTYFDTVYTTTSAVASQITTALTGYVKKGTLTTNTIPKATASDTIGDSSITDDGTEITANGEFYASHDGFNNTELSISPSGIFNTHDVKIVLDAPIIYLPQLTPSELTATDASKNLVSLPVATYPSLTELSYVKGVTSAIQTQLYSKADLFLNKLTTLITHTGTTTETIVYSHEIIAGEVKANDIIRIMAAYSATNNGNSKTIKLYVNDSLSLAGATQMGIYAITTNQGGNMWFGRNIIFQNSLSSQRTVGSTGNILNDEATTVLNTPDTTYTLDFSTNKFIFLTYTLAVSTDTMLLKAVKLKIDR